MKTIEYNGYELSQITDAGLCASMCAAVPSIGTFNLYQVVSTTDETDKTTVCDMDPDGQDIVEFLKEIADDTTPYNDLWLVKKLNRNAHSICYIVFSRLAVYLQMGRY